MNTEEFDMKRTTRFSRVLLILMVMTILVFPCSVFAQEPENTVSEQTSGDTSSYPDVNTPVENPKLTELLAKYRQADDAEYPALVEEIAEEIAMNAYLLLVFEMDDADYEDYGNGKGEFKQGGIMSIPMFDATDGADAYIPAYTDWTELKKGPQYTGDETKTLIVSFDDLAAIAGGQDEIITKGITINPYSDAFVITPANVLSMKEHKEYLTTGKTTRIVQKDTQVTLGDPADFPTEMAEAAAEYARNNPDINAFWLKLMTAENEQSFLMVIDFTGDRETVFAGISDAAVPFLPKGYYLDIVPYEDSFGQQAATGEPCYKRK